LGEVSTTVLGRAKLGFHGQYVNTHVVV